MKIDMTVRRFRTGDVMVVGPVTFDQTRMRQLKDRVFEVRAQVNGRVLEKSRDGSQYILEQLYRPENKHWKTLAYLRFAQQQGKMVMQIGNRQ